jgi:Mrp family chromosome partitioning ATPase
MVALLIVYLWDSVDRRLRSSLEVERQFGYPVVGRVRNEALGHSPNADDRKGAVDPIDWEQFRILRHNLQFLGPDEAPRTIAVTSAMPEEGKTTVACFVAFAAAAAGKRVLLIECDLRRPVLAERLAIKPSPGLTDFVNGAAEPSELLQVVSFSDAAVRNGRGLKSGEPDAVGSGPLFQHELVCVTAGSETSHPVEVLESSAFRAMLQEVGQAYDVVILDTPPVLPVVDALQVIANSEAIVVCGRAAQLTREQARAFKQALERVPERPVGLVVTGIKPSAAEPGLGYYGYYVAERR